MLQGLRDESVSDRSFPAFYVDCSILGVIHNVDAVVFLAVSHLSPRLSLVCKIRSVGGNERALAAAIPGMRGA